MGIQKKETPNETREFSIKELDEIEAINLSDREFRIMSLMILNSMKKDVKP